ncbi:MAG: ArsB/NhaD family transporter [Candidatus Thermoplasmatota archaeon]|nr:ArsB/NhaD family transporter [Candidatus Thermoplasmatota archaeon]
MKHETKINPIDSITDKAGAILGLVILGSCIAGLAIATYIGVQMWMISLGFVLALIIILLLRDSLHAIMRKHVSKNHFVVAPTLKKMPVGIIPFVLALFITVEVLRIYGVTADIGFFFKSICGTSNTSTVFVYGISSAFSANILNNIPMTVAYVPMVSLATQTNVFPAVLATTIGSNLGANITPIGALAGIMWMSILRDKEVKISFKEFVKHGFIVTPVTLLACLGVLAFEFMLF